MEAERLRYVQQRFHVLVNCVANADGGGRLGKVGQETTIECPHPTLGQDGLKFLPHAIACFSHLFV